MKHHMDGEHREGVEECALALAAIQAMADADAMRCSVDLDAHGPAVTSARVVRHGRQSRPSFRMRERSVAG